MNATAGSHGECPVCASSRVGTVTVLEEAHIARCRSCGLLVAEYKPGTNVAGYERIDMTAYDRSIGSMRAQEAKTHVQQMSALLAAGSPMSWLDIGCGVGVLLREAQSANFIVSGVEPDEIARERAQITLGGGISTSLDIIEAKQISYAVVSMLDVLEHISADDLRSMAGRVRRLLSAEGYWLVKVPSSDGLFYRAAEALRRVIPFAARDILRRLWLVDYSWPHRVYFNEANLAKLLENAGFKVVAIRYEPAVTLSTLFQRLTMDPTIPRWKAILMTVPGAIIILLEKIVRKTDSLVMVGART